MVDLTECTWHTLAANLIDCSRIYRPANHPTFGGTVLFFYLMSRITLNLKADRSIWICHNDNVTVLTQICIIYLKVYYSGTCHEQIPLGPTWQVAARQREPKGGRQTHYTTTLYCNTTSGIHTEYMHLMQLLSNQIPGHHTQKHGLLNQHFHSGQ